MLEDNRLFYSSMGHDCAVAIAASERAFGHIETSRSQSEIETSLSEAVVAAREARMDGLQANLLSLMSDQAANSSDRKTAVLLGDEALKLASKTGWLPLEQRIRRLIL